MSLNWAVLGMNYGDESKGLTVARLCRKAKNPLVIRFSGGPQASHKVIKGKVQHIFSTFGSGTLEGAPTALTSDVAVDLSALMNEYIVLKKKNIFHGHLYIDPNCPIITRYDMSANQCDTDNMNNGTCGVGFGKTIERNENHVTLTVDDIINHIGIVPLKLQMIREYYNEIDADNVNMTIINRFRDWIVNDPDFHIRIVKFEDLDNEFDTNIWEGSQGILLDKDIGFFPHVTRSNTDLTNIHKLGISLDEVHFVSRSYLTRHGYGPVYDGAQQLYFEDDAAEHNVSNRYQGSFRKYPLDLDLMKYAFDKTYIKEHTNIFLHITHMDEFDKLEVVINNHVGKHTMKSFHDSISYNLDFRIKPEDIYMYDNPDSEVDKMEL